MLCSSDLYSLEQIQGAMLGSTSTMYIEIDSADIDTRVDGVDSMLRYYNFFIDISDGFIYRIKGVRNYGIAKFKNKLGLLQFDK